MDSVLTPKQIKVLELRARGFTQGRIAEMIGTTRANVSITENRGRKNVMKARNTIRIYEKLRAPARIELSPDTDIFDAPKKVFEFATECRIKVRENSLSLMEMIQREAKDKLQGRRIIERLEITILNDGSVLID